MSKVMSMVRTFLIGLGCVILIGMYCIIQTQKAQILEPQRIPEPPIPSAREIQQRLKDLDDPRYDPGPIDGIPGPKMIWGWDNLIEDRYAKRTFEGE